MENVIESFRITTSIGEGQQEILVIPDDCIDKSLFHLVKEGAEYCKLLYTDKEQWEILGEEPISPEVLLEITKKIEEHYF